MSMWPAGLGLCYLFLSGARFAGPGPYYFILTFLVVIQGIFGKFQFPEANVFHQRTFCWYSLEAAVFNSELTVT